MMFVLTQVRVRMSDMGEHPPSLTLKSYPTVLLNTHITFTGPILFLAMGGRRGVLFLLCPLKITIRIYLPISTLTKSYYMLTSLILRCTVF